MAAIINAFYPTTANVARELGVTSVCVALKRPPGNKGITPAHGGFKIRL